MARHILFLLPPGFEAGGRREFCPECAELNGLLAWYPAIRDTLEIRYQPLAKPRAEMTALIGGDHQNCPTLVLADGTDAGPHASVRVANGQRFLDNARDIAKFFAHAYATPMPRGG